MISMFELRRLTKTIKRYIHFFQYEQEEFRDNIDFYIEDTKKQIIYINSYISSVQNKLDELYKVNIHLYSINPIFVLKPLVFIVQKLLEKIIDIRIFYSSFTNTFSFPIIHLKISKISSVTYICPQLLFS